MKGSDQPKKESSSKSLIRSLARINANKGDAVLHLSCGSDLSRVFIQSGEVVHADGVKELFGGELDGATGRIDYDIGALIAKGVPANDAMSRAAVAIGKFLVERGARSDCNWGLKGGENSPDSVIPLPIGLEKVLVDACLAHLAINMRSDIFEDSHGKIVRVCKNSIVMKRLPPLSFRAYRKISTADMPIDDVLAHISSTAELIDAKRAVQLLFRFGLIEYSGDVRSSTFETPAAPLKDDDSHNEDESHSGWTVEDLEAVERQFSRQHPFQIFGLVCDETSKKITPYDVRSAFRKVAADFHPDRFSGASGEVQGAAERVFSYLNQARSKIDTQEDLDRMISRFMPKKSKDGVVTEIDRTKAKGLLRSAEARMRNGKWSEARDLLLNAIERIPDETRYQILEIFCRGVMKSITYKEAALLIEGLETNTARQHAEKYYRAGWLYKLKGDYKKAKEMYKKSLAHDPNHIDSARELRVIAKRVPPQSESQDKADSKIPFSRFFKKK